MSKLTPWAGWIGGVLGWMLSDQLGSDLAQANCGRADPSLMLLIGLGGAAVVISGGLLSARVWWRGPSDLGPPQGEARRFVGGTGALASCLFLLAILFQTISSFIIPQCHA